MTDEEIAQVKSGVVLVPMTGGSVAVTYNLPGVESGLKLSRDVLSKIFLGELQQWNDPAIAKLNPGVTLPALPIILIYRSDGSGTTATFTAHLSAISPPWKDRVGTGLNVEWPAGVGTKSNAGVSAQIQQAEGAIGYVEYGYAQKLGLPMAALENKAGKFIEPTLDSTQKGLEAVKLAANLTGFNPDPEGENAYPIVTYSWLLLYKQHPDPAIATALKSAVQWGLTEGQKLSAELGYVPLSPDIAKQASAALAQVQP
jgi:phosphate transport system substrate-binding protein